MSATQIGKTFAEACWIVGRAWEDPVRVNPWWWTAPTYNQVRAGFRDITRICAVSGILAGVPVASPFPQVKLINGSVIEGRSRDNPAHLMGDAIAGGVVDEAGQMTPEDDSAISSRRSATLGPLHYIGNPGMTAGPFRRLCAEAQEAGRGFHRWTWSDRYNALLSTQPQAAASYREFIDKERRLRWDVEFRRLYEAEWTEDESAVFQHPERITAGAPIIAPAPDGWYSVGVDTGQQQDYLVAIGIGRASSRADFMLRFRGIPYPMAVDRLMAEVHGIFPCRFVVETNGPGLGLYQELVRRGASCVAFDTTAKSKEQAIQDLAAAMVPERPILTLADMPPLLHELQVFRYLKRGGALTTYAYAAPPGEHDDCVMALALAWYGMSVRMSGQGIFDYYKNLAQKAVTG